MMLASCGGTDIYEYMFTILQIIGGDDVFAAMKEDRVNSAVTLMTE